MAKCMFLLNELPIIEDVLGIIKKFYYYPTNCVYESKVIWDLTPIEIELLEEHLSKEFNINIGINMGSGVNYMVYKIPIITRKRYGNPMYQYIDARNVWHKEWRGNPFANIHYWLSSFNIDFKTSLFDMLCRKLYFEHQSNL
jgi:hypothetical protein